jgi:misacylated tRNA(Ala) deacylase
MTTALFMEDCYLAEFDAKVVWQEGAVVELDRTAFYPESGGQPTDMGTIANGSDVYNIVKVYKDKGRILHELDRTGLLNGDSVHGRIDWKRRHVLMRYHTASHILSTVIHSHTGAEITGNQISLDKARDDFSLAEFDKEKMQGFVDESNSIIAKNLSVTLRMLPREEAFQIPALVKLRMALPESIKIIRVVDIEGFDQQACAGTHVKNTSEIGRIRVTEMANKGKDNRRVYFVLEAPK